MTGFSAELEYPSQKAKENPHPCTQQGGFSSGFSEQIGQTGLIEYKKKNGNQHAINEPMMRPRIKVALRSFFRANLRFSRSASLIPLRTPLLPAGATLVEVTTGVGVVVCGGVTLFPNGR